MTYRVPILNVTGPDSIDYVEKWGSRLIGVKVVRRLTDEHDECTFTFANEPPYLDDPGLNTPFTVSYGWSPDAIVQRGIYYYARTEYSGAPSEGDKVSYWCRSGLTADLEQVDSRHFNTENGNKTLADVFRNVFGNSNVTVEISPSIAGLPIPGGHLVQWQQSNIDFATDLANQVGAIVKPAGGKILVLDRSSAQSVSGAGLLPVNVDKSSCYRYNAEMEPRFLYKDVSANYFDDGSGKLKDQSTAATGTSGAADALPHPAPDLASALTFATARACEYKRYSGTAMFEIPGEPNAAEGCRVIATGFPSAINAVSWIAAQVTDDIEPEAGWITTIETETDTD